LSAPTALQTLIEIPTPTTHHAFLFAPVIAHDPGKGDLIDLELPDGTFLRTQAAPDVLRLGPNINGPWQATLHFSTHGDASLKEPLRLPRLKPCPEDHKLLLPTWGAAGDVTNLDRTEGLISIRVVPQREHLHPFLVTALASLEQLASVGHTSSLRLKGTLRSRCLIVTHLEPIDLDHDQAQLWTPNSNRASQVAPASLVGVGEQGQDQTGARRLKPVKQGPRR
jgi:hypothetical protein